MGVVLGGLLVGNMLKRALPFLRKSLIPVSVIGGLFLLLISTLCKVFTGKYFFNYFLFADGGALTGIEILEILTYHCLALGFIAMTLRKTGSENKKKEKGRIRDVVNSGIVTVNAYLLQGIIGVTVTVVASLLIPKILKAAGLLLSFGFGQGTGQALNYGSIYESTYGFEGGKSFGLTIAAIGFLAAGLGGIVYLAWHKKKGDIIIRENIFTHNNEKVEEEGEIPMVESMDKLTVQTALVIVCYAAAFAVMFVLGKLVGDGLRSTIYGFNFLIGTLMAVILKFIMKLLKKGKMLHRDYVNNFLLSRIAGFAFDIMIVAGIGAIQLDLIKDYLGVLLIMAVLGVVFTFLYIKIVSNKLFPGYRHEEFLVMFGMLTGTASTGVILLREIDPMFETPASDNVVYQTFPAILLGFPMMILAAFCPKSDMATFITLGIMLVYFVVLNVVLFRSKIFKSKKKEQ
jgi:ESS family glutamate:Na+ symporter